MGLSFTIAAGHSQRIYSWGPSPVGLATIFYTYCLRFDSSLFVASYDSQGYGGGIRSRLLHTGVSVSSVSHSLKTVLRELNRGHLIEGLGCRAKGLVVVAATEVLSAVA
jgi:hypothetical protein